MVESLLLSPASGIAGYYSMQGTLNSDVFCCCFPLQLCSEVNGNSPCHASFCSTPKYYHLQRADNVDKCKKDFFHKRTQVGSPVGQAETHPMCRVISRHSLPPFLLQWLKRANVPHPQCENERKRAKIWNIQHLNEKPVRQWLVT